MENETASVRLLHYSDLERAYDDPEKVARLVGAVRRRRTDRTLVVGSGDNISPSVLSLVTGGQQAVTFYEAISPHVDTFGNHDFDNGVSALRDIVDASPQTWVAANVSEGNEQFGADVGVVPVTVIETGDVAVGVVGVCHPETDEMNPKAGDLSFESVLPAARSGVTTVRERGADYVVVVAHVGGGGASGVDGAMLAAMSDADAVLDGHDHDRTGEVIDGTAYARPGQNGRYLMEVTLGEEPSVSAHSVHDEAVHEPTRKALRNLASALDLTETVVELRTPVPCDRQSARCGESRIGNFVTDAYRHVGDADVGIQAPGGIRAIGELAGRVTRWSLVGVVPYADDLVVLDLTGEQLWDTLDRLTMDEVPGARDWYLGHVSGARVVYDGDGTLQSATVAGDRINPAATYTFATSDYFVETDHIFPFFGPSDVIARRGPQYEAVVGYARRFGITQRVEGRITKHEE